MMFYVKICYISYLILSNLVSVSALKFDTFMYFQQRQFLLRDHLDISFSGSLCMGLCVQPSLPWDDADCGNYHVCCDQNDHCCHVTRCWRVPLTRRRQHVSVSIWLWRLLLWFVGEVNYCEGMRIKIKGDGHGNF